MGNERLYRYLAGLWLIASMPLLVAAAEPVERRLHTDRVESSSFLWNDWNRFQENYHPLYAADDDPKTAWVEGNEGSGAGEWLRVRITPLEGTSRVRLRVRNGYQKSAALFKANARARTVEVTLLPSNSTRRVDLADAQGWQEIVVTQPAGRLDTVELRIISVYDGKKYKDLGLSDVQVFATATTPDNPAFEKSKRGRLMKWKRERIAAAKLFKSQRGTGMPLAPQYQVAAVDGWKLDAKVKQELETCYSGECYYAAMLEVAKQASPRHKAALELAGKAVGAPSTSWKPVQVVDKDKRPFPVIDGLYTPDPYMAYEGYVPADQFDLPMTGSLGSLTTDSLGVFAVTDGVSADRSSCQKNAIQAYAWSPRADKDKGKSPAPAATDTRQRTDVLRFRMCRRIEVRDGTEEVTMEQLVVYDSDGRLALVIGQGYVSLYEWREGQPVAVISGGRRVYKDYDLGFGQLVLTEASPAGKP